MIRIAGVDEAGRGPLAGPVVGAAVIFPDGYSNRDIRDSKKLSPKKRELLYREITSHALAWSIVAVGHRRIESLNILRASLLAMSLAAMRTGAEMVLVDGNQRLPISIPQETIVGGDDKEISISAASILAKVTRDGLMKRLDLFYPGYGFSSHFGYPTAEHRASISLLGPSPVHRRTFSGVKEFIHLNLFAA